MPLASDIMNASGALLNDTGLTIYNYGKQIPYLNVAQGELRENMELAGVPASNETSAAILVAAGETTIGDVTGPQLPPDLIEIQQAAERIAGTSDGYIGMTRVAFLPNWIIPINYQVYWSWQAQIIRLPGATNDIEIQLKYIATKLPDITDPADEILLFNASTFLEFRTAGLCAEFIGENPTRADKLNNFAGLALDRFLGISTKGQQSIFTRRRPFRAGYRSGGFV